MRQITIAAAAIALALGVAVEPASAGDEHGWKPARQHSHLERRGALRPHIPAVQLVQVGVRRRYVNETLPLRRLLGLGREYRGYRVEAVTVNLRPRGTRGRLALLADGRIADRARVHHIHRVRLTLDHDRTLGRDVGRLQLAVDGRAFIDSIQVRLRAAPPRFRRGPHHRSGHGRRVDNAELAQQLVELILERIEHADRRN